MAKDIFFNIMVRTSNRPNYFSDCIKSIRSQIYENYKIIVSVDNYFSKKYVEKLNIKPVSINLVKKKIFKTMHHIICILMNYISTLMTVIF